MKKYKVSVPVSFLAVTIVEAESEAEAIKEVLDMECTPCVHGSFFCGEHFAEGDLVLDDGMPIEAFYDEIEAEEYE